MTRRAHGVTVAGVAAVALTWSGVATAGWGTTTTFVVTTVLSLGVGAALHRAVEQPFLQLRDRVLPTNPVPTRATRRRSFPAPCRSPRPVRALLSSVHVRTRDGPRLHVFALAARRCAGAWSRRWIR